MQASERRLGEGWRERLSTPPRPHARRSAAIRARCTLLGLMDDPELRPMQMLVRRLTPAILLRGDGKEWRVSLRTRHYHCRRRQQQLLVIQLLHLHVLGGTYVSMNLPTR